MTKSTFYEQQMAVLSRHTASKPLSQVVRGIEKENLRVAADGRYVAAPHPAELGSALTHPFVTTDFSEALLECITPPTPGRSKLFADLNNITAWVTQQLDKQGSAQYLWPYSMPYLLDESDVDDVPIANYGTSSRAQMKMIYRHGLAHRYGKAMQMIAGLHYNISWPRELMLALGPLPGMPLDDHLGEEQAIITQRYMGLIRNFCRHQWLIPYLFGASPACFSGSLYRRKEPRYLKERQGDLHWGVGTTSLRLSSLGYHNKSQAAIALGFASIGEYARDLLAATQVPYSSFDSIKVVDDDGNYQQLNNHLLQIENEYYFNIRPKATPTDSRRPAVALYESGVEYIELRGLDLNPMEPLGLAKETSQFCDLFLLYLMIKPSDRLTSMEKTVAGYNLRSAVELGRSDAAEVCYAGSSVSLTKQAQQMLDDMLPLACWMDEAESDVDGGYQQVLDLMKCRVQDKGLLPSSVLMQHWQQSNISFAECVIEMQREHHDEFMRQSLSSQLVADWEKTAASSLAEQDIIEQKDQGLFAYLDNYFSQVIPEK